MPKYLHEKGGPLYKGGKGGKNPSTKARKARTGKRKPAKAGK